MAAREESGGTGQALLYVGMVAAVAAVGGLLFGYDSGAILYLRRDFPTDAATEGLVVGVVTLGALVGAMGQAPWPIASADVSRTSPRGCCSSSHPS